MYVQLAAGLYCMCSDSAVHYKMTDRIVLSEVIYEIIFQCRIMNYYVRPFQIDYSDYTEISRLYRK